MKQVLNNVMTKHTLTMDELAALLEIVDVNSEITVDQMEAAIKAVKQA